MNSCKKIISVVGTRPNFVKVAPIDWVLRDHPRIDHQILHTGQHYSAFMSEVFFKSLDVTEPVRNLQVGSGSHGAMTGSVMIELERALMELEPDAVLVIGDVNSTLAAAVDAKKLHIPVIHLESGYRSFDMRMPEEVNRIVTDSISDLLITFEPVATQNLLAEGHKRESILESGDVQIDALVRILGQDEVGMEVPEGGYILATFHRPSNVDDRGGLSRLVDVLNRLSEVCEIIFPCHPRTHGQLVDRGLLGRLHGRVRVIEPVDYPSMLRLIRAAAVIITDSGGLQSEATFLDVPCVTLRETTEKRLTVESGTNVLAGRDVENLYRLALERYEERERFLRSGQPALWDGEARFRIVQRVEEFLGFGVTASV